MRIILLILTLFIAVCKGIGQTTITYGTDLTGMLLNTGDVHSYTFQGEIGDKILVRMRGMPSGVDACISLLSNSGDTLAISCSTGLSTFTYELTEAGTYYLQAADNRHNDTGEYGLSLEILNKLIAATPVTACESDIAGILEHRAEVDAFTFRVNAGEKLRIRMRGGSDNIEARYQLYDQAGALLLSSTINAGIADAGLIDLTEAGDYLLLVMDHRGNDTGDYSLSVKRILAKQCATPIDCDVELTAELTSFAQIDAYRFEAEAGDFVTAFMRGIPMNLEGYLELYDPDGKIIATSASQGHLSRIDPLVLPESGTYMMLAMDKSGNDKGAYALALQFIGSAHCGNKIHCKNNSQPEKLSQYAEVDAYVFEGQIGEIVNLEAVEEEAHLELKMELYAPDGTLLKMHSGREAAFVEAYELPQSGLYTILVMDYEGNDEGIYHLKVDAPSVALNCMPVYCTSSAQSSTREWIESVVINGVENISGNDGGYGDFTAMPIQVHAGGYYTLSIQPGFSISNNLPLRECYRVWIDLNQDNDFFDAGEMVYRGSAMGTVNASMVIPATALPGKTRIRISMSYTSLPVPCEQILFGEVEDYTVEILEPIACGDLPERWKSQDVGNPNNTGMACYQEAANTFVIHSNGYDIYNKKDEFYFVHTQIGDNENLSITTRVKSITATGEAALAGLMVRESLDEDAANVLLAVSLDGKGYLQHRKKANKSTKSKTLSISAPSWLKIEKKKDEFKAYTSTDGSAWTFVGKAKVKMPDNFYLGLAVSSFDQERINISTFDEVTITDIPDLEQDGGAVARSVERVDMNLASPRNFIVYPNPGRGHLFVTTDAIRSPNFELLLYSAAGQRVLHRKFQKSGSDQVRLDWSSPLPSGHYRLILKDGKEILTQNVMILE